MDPYTWGLIFFVVVVAGFCLYEIKQIFSSSGKVGPKVFSLMARLPRSVDEKRSYDVCRVRRWVPQGLLVECEDHAFIVNADDCKDQEEYEKIRDAMRPDLRWEDGEKADI